MLKIVYLINQLRQSGPVNVLRNIIQNLDRNHYKPIIIKFMQDDINRSITDKFLELDVDIYEMNLSFWSLELRTYTVAKKLDLLLLEIAPDVIHMHGYHPVLVASLLKYRVPKVETLHCISKEDYPLSKGFFIGNWMNLRYLKSLQSIDYCAAISKTVCEFYNNKLTSNKNVLVIYNGVEVLDSIGKSTEDTLYTSLKLEKSDLIFLVVGALSKRKDPETIIKAFRLASKHESRMNMRLIFLGMGPLMDKCKSLSEGNSNIEFRGYVFNVFDYLKVADFSICASHSEGFGLNYIESLMAGTPVISSKIGPFNEFSALYPQLAQLQFAPGNVSELADKMILAVNTVKQQEMKEISLDVCNRFSAKTMAISYMRLYDKMWNEYNEKL